jgi:hypothetical protein
MIILIDFKTYLDIEKNSEIIGRMFAAYCSKINGTSDFISAKNVVWIGQNTKLMYKMQLFLSTDYCYYKKILMIIPRFQKQTP